MIDFSDIHDDLIPYLPAVTLEFVQDTAVFIARDICTHSKQWVSELDAVDTVSGQAAYDLEPSEGQSEVVAVTRLVINSSLLWDVRPVHGGLLRHEAPKYEDGSPPFTLNSALSELTLIEDEVPTSSVTAGMTGSAVLRPKKTASALPDMFGDFTMSEGLRNGVLGRILLMPSRPWSNTADGQYYQNQYMNFKHLLANRAGMGNTRTQLRVRKWG